MTGGSGSARTSPGGCQEHRSIYEETTKDASPSRVSGKSPSPMGDDDSEGFTPMDKGFCNVAQGAISHDERGVSPLSTSRRVAINAMMDLADKKRGDKKGITSPAKVLSTVSSDSEEESDGHLDIEGEDLVYHQALIDKAMVDQCFENIQKMRALRQEKGKGVARAHSEVKDKEPPLSACERDGCVDYPLYMLVCGIFPRSLLHFWSSFSKELQLFVRIAGLHWAGLLDQIILGGPFSCSCFLPAAGMGRFFGLVLLCVERRSDWP
ncbi:hypothetical protein U1Q18_027980 [Sarracenia purpurea var. burkii]